MSRSKARAEAAAEVASEAEEEEQAGESMQLVEKLQEFGINAGDIAKLKTAGIYTFAFMTSNNQQQGARS